MKTKLLPVALLIAFLLSGCSLFDGQFHRITPHKMPSSNTVPEAYSAKNYGELRVILAERVASGAESCVIYAEEFPIADLERAMKDAAHNIRINDPIGAFAVDEIVYQIGSNNGKTAVAVDIRYRINTMEIRKMKRVEDINEAIEKILESLGSCNPGIVFYITSYQKVDFTQIVEDLAFANPQTVMEIPRTTENVYGEGSSRVVELTFSFETGRDVLRQMQSQVRPIFDSAVLYVSGDGSDNQKLAQLYAFLMERFEYSVETSITPAYSLLRHGVGDSRAFATVYAAMCRKAGLDCRTVTGTKMGESWTWNIVRDGDRYYHVDLLQCSAKGHFAEKTDAEMTGYVWDYSAYPACTGGRTNAAPVMGPDLGAEKEF